MKYVSEVKTTITLLLIKNTFIMKTTTKRMMLALCACCFVSFAGAKDIYVSETGNDSKDGMSAANAVKNLSRVHQLVEPGDVIHVSGVLDISADPVRSSDRNNFGYVLLKGSPEGPAGFYIKGVNWDNVTFQGENPEVDGFSGNNQSRTFSFDSGNYTFKNLMFTKGRELISDGGCGLWIRNTNVVFENCHFTDNTPQTRVDGEGKTVIDKTNGRGGAIMHFNETLTFINCEFSGNQNKLGGCIFTQGGNLNIKGCKFMDNDNQEIKDTNGAVIYTWAQNATEQNILIEESLFSGNRVSEEGGAIALRNISLPDAPYTTNLTIRNSSFISNYSTLRGGAIMLNNRYANTKDIVTITNSTFYGNTAKADGGNICLWAVQPNSKFDVVNCSFIGNVTEGNAGHGAAIIIMNNEEFPKANLTKRFYNCLFDKNISLEGEGGLSDFWYRPVNDQLNIAPGELTIKNCLIGATNLPASDFEDNLFNYASEEPDLAGLDDYEYYGDYYSCIPLYEDSPARTYGNAEYLTQFGIEESDQLGKSRTLEGTSCVIGALEVTSAELDDDVYIFPPVVTGIGASEVEKEGLNVLIANNEIKVLDVETGRAVITVIGMSGSIAKSGVDQLSVQDLAKGVYVVKVQVGNEIYVRKIMK